MGKSVSRIHSKEDNKEYNILPMGQMPTVVFGRTIKQNSIPGTMYFFKDGNVKILDPDAQNSMYVEHCFSRPVVFTVPNDFDYSKREDFDYISQFVTSSDGLQLNANTYSPNYIIRNNEIICVKQGLDDVRIRYYRKNRSRRRRGNRYTLTNCQGPFNPEKKYHTRTILVIPIARRRKSSLSIFQYEYRQEFPAIGNFNIHAMTWDDNDNYCYFRMSFLYEKDETYYWRVSQFERLGESDPWEEYFDFEKLHRGDILTSTWCPENSGAEGDFYNERTDGYCYIYADSLEGSMDLDEKGWKYYPVNTLKKRHKYE